MSRWGHGYTCLGTSLLLALVAASPATQAKCLTSRLDIQGAALTRRISISEPAIPGQFNIWNGPRVRVNGKPVHQGAESHHGQFIKWSAGAIEEFAQEGLSFAVSFFCRFDPSGDEAKIYEVEYLIDPELDGGYLYLPGRGDRRYQSNTSSIVHFVEGNWFHSTDRWERLIRPVIVDALGQ